MNDLISYSFPCEGEFADDCQEWTTSAKVGLVSLGGLYDDMKLLETGDHSKKVLFKWYHS